MPSYFTKITISLLASVASLHGGNFEIDRNESELAATMHASPSHDFTSVATEYICDIELNPETLTVEKAVCSLEFADLDSGKSSRDKKMRGWIDVDKHPSAQFVFEKRFPDNEVGERVAQGTFSMHGVDRPITIAYTLRRESGQLVLDGHGELNHKDWGLEQVRFLFFSVNPLLKLHFHLVGTLEH